MEDNLVPYVVRQGDYLAKIAHVLGLDAETVWSHPRNVALAKTRKPNLLQPGDVLWVPAQPAGPMPIAHGSTNSFVARVPRTKVRLVFRADGGVLANAACEIHWLGRCVDRTQTDADGRLEVEVPVTVEQFLVVFTKPRVTHRIHVGEMDPAEERSGIRKRLQNLGFYCEAARGMGDTDFGEEEHGEFEATGLRAFQRVAGLEPTGVLDDATRAALLKEHGA